MKTKLEKDEVLLRGESFFNNGKFTVNDVVKRIDYLIENVLTKIASRDAGWTKLYRDDADGRYWELFYDRDNLRSEGPPTLKYIPEAEAKEKYNI